MLSTGNSEVKCETCGYECCFDLTQWNYMLQTGGKITRIVGRRDIAKYTLVRFLTYDGATCKRYEMLIFCMEWTGGGLGSWKIMKNGRIEKGS